MSNYRTLIFTTTVSICTIAGSVPGWACFYDLQGVGYPPECGNNYQQQPQQPYVPPQPSAAEVAAQQANAQGLVAYAASDWILAAQRFKQAMELNPNDSVLVNNWKNANYSYYNEVGLAKFDHKDFNDALNVFLGALKWATTNQLVQVTNGNIGTTYLNLAESAQKTGDYPTMLRLAKLGLQYILVGELPSVPGGNVTGIRNARNLIAVAISELAKTDKDTPTLKDSRPVADNRDYTCSKQLNGKFWCTGTTGKFATPSCKWCPSDKISNLCAAASCSQK